MLTRAEAVINNSDSHREQAPRSVEATKKATPLSPFSVQIRRGSQGKSDTYKSCMDYDSTVNGLQHPDFVLRCHIGAGGLHKESQLRRIG